MDDSLVTHPTLLQGYGVTLGTINCLAVLTSIFQAIPSLGLQVCRRWGVVKWRCF